MIGSIKETVIEISYNKSTFSKDGQNLNIRAIIDGKR